MHPDSPDTSPRITLVSSFTLDRFPPDAHGHRLELTGGPAHYVGAALTRLGVPYRLITGDRATVEVIPGPEGEHYIIQPLSCIALPPVIASPAVIFSPIVAEINPHAVPAVEGLLVLDLQGFVRRPLRPTDEMVHVDLSCLLERADIVKASDAELQHLTPESLAALGDALVLQTLGVKGAVIHQGATSIEIESRPVPAAHTVGAGDTFLAAFVAAYLERLDVLAAGERAARFTEDMLRERLEHA
jgi:pfkB family carbohydrate kinase